MFKNEVIVIMLYTIQFELMIDNRLYIYHFTFYRLVIVVVLIKIFCMQISIFTDFLKNIILN